MRDSGEYSEISLKPIKWMEEKRPVHDKINLPVKIKFKKEAELD